MIGAILLGFLAWAVFVWGSFTGLALAGWTFAHVAEAPARRRAARAADAQLRKDAAARRARAAFIATLPRTKSGELFPAGKRALAQYDRSAK